jgi:hypothetical protein
MRYGTTADTGGRQRKAVSAICRPRPDRPLSGCRAARLAGAAAGCSAARSGAT